MLRAHSKIPLQHLAGCCPALVWLCGDCQTSVRVPPVSLSSTIAHPRSLPLSSFADSAEVAGCLAAAGLVLILSACLSIYGSATFQGEDNEMSKKTLTGRALEKDPLQVRGRGVCGRAVRDVGCARGAGQGRGHFGCGDAVTACLR